MGVKKKIILNYKSYISIIPTTTTGKWKIVESDNKISLYLEVYKRVRVEVRSTSLEDIINPISVFFGADPIYRIIDYKYERGEPMWVHEDKLYLTVTTINECSCV